MTEVNTEPVEPTPAAAISTDGRPRRVRTRARSAKAPAPRTARAPTQKTFRGSIAVGPDRSVPAALASSIRELQAALGMPVWCLVQARRGPFSAIDEELLEAFHLHRGGLPSGQRIALVIDSPGGSARCAFQLAKLFRRHSGGFTAVIPRYAKSAATLLSLGAEEILLGVDAELGPLDAQFMDPEREDYSSTLDEVQAFARLHARALEAVDEAMFTLVQRTDKKVSTLLPLVLDFVADTMRPLLEKIDAVHYAQMARVLKVAEEYAVRLLYPRYTVGEARSIASHLVEHYPEHEFAIDADEARSFGLRIESPVPKVSTIIEAIHDLLPGQLLIGRLEEVKNAKP